MARVEKKAGEDLMGMIAQRRLEVLLGGRRVFERIAPFQHLPQVAPRQFEDGAQLRGLGGPQPALALQVVLACAQQPTQPPERRQQPGCDLQDREPAAARAQQHGEQLRVGQRGDPLPGEFFPGPDKVHERAPAPSVPRVCGSVENALCGTGRRPVTENWPQWM
jgi:hypothetical protein